MTLARFVRLPPLTPDTRHSSSLKIIYTGLVAQSMMGISVDHVNVFSRLFMYPVGVFSCTEFAVGEVRRRRLVNPK